MVYHVFPYCCNMASWCQIPMFEPNHSIEYSDELKSQISEISWQDPHIRVAPNTPDTMGVNWVNTGVEFTISNHRGHGLPIPDTVLHVWNIYLHLPHVNIPYMEHMGYNSMNIGDIFRSRSWPGDRGIRGCLWQRSSRVDPPGIWPTAVGPKPRWHAMAYFQW